MLKNSMLLKLGIGGSILAVLCCATPILVVLLGIVGLGALTGYLDYVLMPALVVFVGITIYALQKRQQVHVCCTIDHPGEKQ
jgi:hypothetical protein